MPAITPVVISNSNTYGNGLRVSPVAGVLFVCFGVFGLSGVTLPSSFSMKFTCTF